jgi:hypothetical protein
MTIVVVRLVVSVVPVPVVSAKVSPATTLVADAALPTRIKVTTTDIDMTGWTMLYHYMGTCWSVRMSNHIVMATHIM